ncbi:hypothetical protein DPMN_053854 [Dreissena polymorpha]|uniref:Uncharacterized protein n=1 Tax=Dreissena polymorpha TaxID=45954 RepID=A0A9D4CM60_DREPO|nr:hypothetical protein DPMN_053854 [Dreissena polymorpha]
MNIHHLLTIQHAHNIIRKNVLTKFHEDLTINLIYRVLTRKNALPPGRNVFESTRTILQLIQDIIETNILKNFNKVLLYIGKNATSPGGNIFQHTGIILDLFHEDLTIMASIVLTRKNALSPGGHISRNNVLTKFHEDWTINVTSNSVLKNALPPWQPYIVGTNLLTKFHEDRTIMWPLEKNAPHPASHVFQPSRTIFELFQDIIGKNLLTKFLLTRQMLMPHDGQKAITKAHCAQLS